MSFTFDFSDSEFDEVYFSYAYPYTFTRLIRFIRELKLDPDVSPTVKDSVPICSSLSGIDVPLLTVTQNSNNENANYICNNKGELVTTLSGKKRRKKTVIITGRVHPGEANSSFMMEGFIRFITSPNNQLAKELRKRIVFKIVPMLNVDGVVAGNYRCSMSGSDLNRKYHNPHQKLHPVVCAVKKLINQEKIDAGKHSAKQIVAFFDLHGHSRKKNVFMYGPEFPIHDMRYLKMRVLPKIMSEQSQKFRFYSCKFRVQKSKEKTARVVLWREFNITNCFTLEASFYGYFDQSRETRHFEIPDYN